MTKTTEADDWEPIFSYGEADAVGDNIEAVVHNDGLTITIEQPWAGDTQTGFGNTTSIRMDKTTARMFGEWLIQWAGSAENAE